MLKRLFIIAFLLSSVIAALADTLVSFPETSHNFGAFAEEDGPVSCRFAAVNIGNEALVILSARATCGCTQPKYPREPVAPGDTAWIDVTYDPSYRPGRFEKTVTVETNTNPSRNKLIIRGTVIGGDGSVSSRYPADFGQLKLEHNTVMMGDVTHNAYNTVYLRAYNQSPDTIGATFSGAPQYLDIEMAPNPVPPGEQASILFVYNGNGDGIYGFQEDTVAISVAGSEPRDIPVSFNVHEDFSKLSEGDRAKAPVARLDRETCDLGKIRNRHASLRDTLTLSNLGDKPLKVRRVYSLDPGVEANVETTAVKPGESTKIAVTVDPSQSKGGMINVKLIIITNDPANPVQTVRLVAEYPTIERAHPRR